MQRDQYKDTAYFEYALADKLEYIKDREANEANYIPARRFSGLLFKYRQLFSIEYSQGKDVASLKPHVQKVFEYFIRKTEVEDSESSVEKLKDYIGIYEDVLDILSLGILFHIEPEMLEKFKNLCDNLKGRDLLLEHIWCLYKKADFVEPPKTKIKLLFPKSYTLAESIFQSMPSEQEDTALQYIHEWMKTKRSATWFGYLKNSQVGGASTYIGYWNLEGAAIAHLLNLKLSDVEKAKYFPTDLLIYANEQRDK